MTVETLRGIVAGAGSIGRRHAMNLQEMGVEVVVSDPDVEARDRIETDFELRTYPSLSTALTEEESDFLVVAAPTRFHVDLALEGAKAGNHVLIEKPLSDDMTGIDELERTVNDNELVSLVGSNLRFLPELKKVRELLRQDVIGNIISARIQGGSYLPGWFPESDYRESYSAREDLGGGVILDYIHEINYARWFFGEFRTVSGMVDSRSHLDTETNDVASFLAESIDGPICEFHLDYVQRPYSRSCHIIGERGTIRWSWEDGQVRWQRAEDEEWTTYERPKQWETNDMYVDEMTHFLECIRSGSESICPVSCGRKDLSVALAVRESSRTGTHVTV